MALKGEGVKAMQQMKDLFRVALGLEQPWVVNRIEFSQEKAQLDLWLDLPAGSRRPFPGPRRGQGHRLGNEC